MIDYTPTLIADSCVSGITHEMVQTKVPSPAILKFIGKEARGFVAQMLVLAKKEGYQPQPAPELNKVEVYPFPNYGLVIMYQDDCVVATARAPVDMIMKLMEYRYAEGDENAFTADEEN